MIKLKVPCKLAVAAAVATLLVFNAKGGTCTINCGANVQTIDGFGFSSAWCGTLSSAKNNSLYSTLGMSLLRVRFDQNTNNTSEIANASAAHVGGAKVLGCAWTAPAYMLVTNNGLATLSSSYYTAYVGYLKQAATSINVDYVSLKNEPNLAGEDFDLSSSQIETLMQSYVPSIGKPMAMADAFNFDNSVTDPTLDNTTACANTTYVSGHIYGSGNIIHTNAIAHGKHVWMTEHYLTGGQDSVSESMALAQEVSTCMNNQMSAYIWWWVYDTDTNVNLVDESGNIHKIGYVLGQFAKYVRPGKVACSTTFNPSSNVYVTGYHSGGVVIVAVNTGTSSVNQTFTIQNATGVTSFLVNRTSSSESMASETTASVANNTFTYTLPAQSITTFHQF